MNWWRPLSCCTGFQLLTKRPKGNLPLVALSWRHDGCSQLPGTWTTVAQVQPLTKRPNGIHPLVVLFLIHADCFQSLDTSTNDDFSDAVLFQLLDELGKELEELRKYKIEIETGARSPSGSISELPGRYQDLQSEIHKLKEVSHLHSISCWFPCHGPCHSHILCSLLWAGWII